MMRIRRYGHSAVEPLLKVTVHIPNEVTVVEHVEGMVPGLHEPPTLGLSP